MKFLSIICLLLLVSCMSNEFDINLEQEPLPKNNNFKQGLQQLQNNDYYNAISSFEKAFQQGIKESAYYLGNIYYYGPQAIQNLNKTEMWLQKGVNLNDKASQYLMGEIMLTQNKNSTEALNLFQLSANQNYAPAMYRLSKIYFHGNLVGKNDNKAYNYALKAAKQNHKGAMKLLVSYYNLGYGTDIDKEKAARWDTIYLYH